MITFQVDQASLQHVQKKLGTMQSKAPIVISESPEQDGGKRQAETGKQSPAGIYGQVRRIQKR